MPPRCTGKRDHLSQVHGQHIVPVGVAVLGRGAAANDAGVIDKDIDLPSVRFQFTEQLLDRVAAAQVARVMRKVAPGRAHQCFDVMVTAWRRTADPDDVGTGVSQGARDGSAYALGASGDQRRAARQIEGTSAGHSQINSRRGSSIRRA